MPNNVSYFFGLYNYWNLQFLDLFGDAQSVKKADYRHSKLFSSHKSTAESRKRHADDYLVSDRTKFAKSLVSTSAPSVMGAYPTTQNQWAAGYGVQPQAWPQASQTQAQQWNLGYAQQVRLSLSLLLCVFFIFGKCLFLIITLVSSLTIFFRDFLYIFFTNIFKT